MNLLPKIPAAAGILLLASGCLPVRLKEPDFGPSASYRPLAFGAFGARVLSIQ
ncbi:MAG: hypothetical protein ABIQ90_03660 [Polaromonas sp.]